MIGEVEATSTAHKLEAQIRELKASVEHVITGKSEVVELAIVALLARGHLLIEDVPGIGKTTLAHALARSFDCTFQRIQFTSDLLPSDLTGVSIFNQLEHQFEFRQGPLLDLGEWLDAKYSFPISKVPEYENKREG